MDHTSMPAMPGMSPGWMLVIHVCIIVEIALGAIPAVLAWRTSVKNRSTLKSMNGNTMPEQQPETKT